MNSIELEMLNQIFKKRAVLFVGAGFSLDAANFENFIPNSKTLSHIICDLMSRAHDDNLRDISDFFFYEYCKKNQSAITSYCNKMQHLFTIKNAPEYYDAIIKVPWKRIYTTNYDDLIEFLGKRNNKLIKSYSLNNKNKEIADNICLHINGNLYDLNTSTYDSALKLSSSSYVSSDEFIKSSWFSLFNDDLETSSSIIFVGYSLYDINIEKVLYQHSNLKNKIYFIQNKDINDIDRFKLEKYGKVLNISTKGFCSLINEYMGQYEINDEEFFTVCFIEFNIDIQEKVEVNETVKENFLMIGDLDYKYYYKALSDNNYSSFMVIRSKLDEALVSINEHKYLVITGSLGNGKSVFISQIMTKLYMNGEHVFYLLYGNNIAVCKQDIDKIHSQNYTSYIVIDSYSKHMDIVKYIIDRNYDNIKLILADRTTEYQHNILNFNGIKHVVLEIDQLNEKEINVFYQIINNIYLWSDHLKKYKYHRRKEYMVNNCNGEISLILTDILKSKQIQEKITDSVKNIMNDESSKYMFFLICLLNVLNIKISVAILKYILDDYDYKIFNNKELEHFFQLDLFSKQINAKSSIFSSYILSYIFDSQYVLDKCIDLLIKLENHHSYENDYMLAGSLDGLKVDLFRFNFIESILPNTNKLNNLTSYYTAIQNNIPKVARDPQYWLQYAMCFIAYNNKFDKGQKYLDKAYECAQNTRYDLHKIDNQQARLYLKQALYIKNPSEALDYFYKANEVLTKHRNDIYKYKIMLDYKKFVNNNYTLFDETTKQFILNVCKKHHEILTNFINETFYANHFTLNNCLSSLEWIINRLS